MVSILPTRCARGLIYYTDFGLFFPTSVCSFDAPGLCDLSSQYKEQTLVGYAVTCGLTVYSSSSNFFKNNNSSSGSIPLLYTRPTA